MHRHMLKAKLHRVRVTAADLDYEGSLSVDADLLKAAGMVPYEIIKVYNVNNGERFETYLIEAPSGSGEICLNGAAARKGHRDDLLILVTSCWLSQEEMAKHEPTVVLVDAQNRVQTVLKGDQPSLHLAR